MKAIFFLVSTFIFLFSATPLMAQVENNGGRKTIGKIRSVITTNAKEIEKPSSIKIDGANGFKKAYEKEQKKVKKKQQEENFNNKGIISQAKLSEERFLKSFKKINGMYQYPVIDQDLGSIRTNANSINIICRDYQHPDGDRVTILINGIPIIVNIVLQQRYQKFNIPLEKGINKITILALNQGTSGPNTAGFKVFNDTGMLLSSNEWNLATGAKATMVIAKDK
jgi:hypothetical protein|tara:strand:+ start:8901 stop:9572 length:672 start_codon:yes stop_codon:yes gene_type:complete